MQLGKRWQLATCSSGGFVAGWHILHDPPPSPARCRQLPCQPIFYALQLLKKFGEDARVDIVVSWPGGW